MSLARAAVVTLASCLIAASAHAGINFSGAPAVDVAPKPEFMATGDLNEDGRDDIVVVSPSSKEVDVFLAGDTASRYSPSRTSSFGQVLNNLALGDFNRDLHLDIVVTDQAGGAINVLLGRGDGTFQNPNPIKIGRHPVAVAVADFDGVNGPDIAVVDDRLGQLFLLSNDGQNPPDFRVVINPAVGLEPTDVRVIDLNNDDKPDLITLNTGGPRVKELAVMLLERVVNPGTPQAIPDFSDPQKFTIGERPSALVVADFNNDGNDDVAMLNRPSGIGNSDIDVMISQGNGILFPPVSRPVPCPFFTNGAPCRSIAMVAADFDDNGNVDLAVAIADPRRSRGSASNLADAMQMFSGRGDGVFVPGGIFSVGKVPVSMAASDITGDGLPDISVANQRTLDLQCFVNVSTPAEKGNGDPCLLGDECISARCTNGVCCGSQCEADEVCNIPGREGICTPIPPVPVDCETTEECGENEFCVDNVCCDQSCEGGRCDVPGYVGLCIPGACDGCECNGDDRECSSGFCSDQFVCCREECDGGFCDDLGICHGLKDLAEECNLDEECASNVCDSFDGICCNRRCDEIDEFCNGDGRCEPFEPVTETPANPGTPTPTPTRRSTPVGPGNSCSVGAECTTDFCVNEVCCQTSSCEPDQHCQAGTGVCVEGTPATPSTRTPTSTPLATRTGGTQNCGGQCAPQNCINNVCVVSSTSSGCSTGGSDGTGGGNLLIASLMPLALWIGRRWQLKRAVARAVRR